MTETWEKGKKQNNPFSERAGYTAWLLERYAAANQNVESWMPTLQYLILTWSFHLSFKAHLVSHILLLSGSLKQQRTSC